ncbi:sensor histidine kinase [Marinisporobacter balticus]|uniref:histidine kinase n=1 Tax=Marinisporobacter balticus TaxID=2018667 RepID=A0A4R2KP42_9FIRM|nr:GHKL domain-containing protein [Marinisporobacter balticus]TCO74377.1 sensor kinase SpoOB-type protein [Marinisporobacter balticus]
MKISIRAHILVGLILLQSFIGMFLTNNTILRLMGNMIVQYQYPNYMAIIINILGFSAIICIFYITNFLKTEKESIIKLNNSKEVIDALQGQKHDFANHLNLIAGMLQLGKNEKALEYIFKIAQKVEGVFCVSKIENVEIAATLGRKCTIAESKGIRVELDISTSLENTYIDSIELCTVLFNLIDNAIYELEHCKDDDKVLNIDVGEYEDEWIIIIGNSFPILEKDCYEKIFEKGYSTKEGENHGYGLHIVKQIIERNKGKIMVESYEEVGTLFTIFLPVKNQVVKTV